MRVACFIENALYYTKISCEDEKYEQELYKRFFKTLFKKRQANHKKYFNAIKQKQYKIIY